MPKSPRAKVRATPRKPSRKPKPPVRVVARLAAPQATALEKEARRRRADVSEVVAEAVSVWMAIRPAQRAIIRAFAQRQDLTRPEVLRQALDAWMTSLDPRDG